MGVPRLVDESTLGQASRHGAAGFRCESRYAPTRPACIRTVRKRLGAAGQVWQSGGSQGRKRPHAASHHRWTLRARDRSLARCHGHGGGRTTAASLSDRQSSTPMHRTQPCVGPRRPALPAAMSGCVPGHLGPLHSHRLRRNFIRSSPARKRWSLISGASRRASAFSFISRLAST